MVIYSGLFISFKFILNSFLFLMDDVNAFGLWLHQPGTNDGNIEPLYTCFT
jgi:hypothetical protein